MRYAEYDDRASQTSRYTSDDPLAQPFFVWPSHITEEVVARWASRAPDVIFMEYVPDKSGSGL